MTQTTTHLYQNIKAQHFETTGNIDLEDSFRVVLGGNPLQKGQALLAVAAEGVLGEVCIVQVEVVVVGALGGGELLDVVDPGGHLGVDQRLEARVLVGQHAEEHDEVLGAVVEAQGVAAVDGGLLELVHRQALEHALGREAEGRRLGLERLHHGVVRVDGVRHDLAVVLEGQRPPRVVAAARHLELVGEADQAVGAHGEADVARDADELGQAGGVDRAVDVVQRADDDGVRQPGALGVGPEDDGRVGPVALGAEDRDELLQRRDDARTGRGGEADGAAPEGGRRRKGLEVVARHDAKVVGSALEGAVQVRVLVGRVGVDDAAVGQDHLEVGHAVAGKAVLRRVERVAAAQDQAGDADRGRATAQHHDAVLGKLRVDRAPAGAGLDGCDGPVGMVGGGVHGTYRVNRHATVDVVGSRVGHVPCTTHSKLAALVASPLGVIAADCRAGQGLDGRGYLLSRLGHEDAFRSPVGIIKGPVCCLRADIVLGRVCKESLAKAGLAQEVTLDTRHGKC
ncbi:hypothetical protein PpBr36_04907 [Pyricularia pennisetigena]|uniref:hypothetical protein n=1 Tax=Pyricularia pennisetigena TaxID=1578925 RepID=UPI001153F161|nr:hypothetical protein PpBr36_04907 [Pyricularia pennisetigena]TLS27204.1 hypothetical protein PpBr36_04907 [Pyricularia pennisetigena]